MHVVSIVVPCYNEEDSIPIFYRDVNKITDSMHERWKCDFELIFIDDGSTDGTLEIVEMLSAKDPTVHFLSFSRNFGKEAAVFAGLKHAKGDYVVTMDVDMQDPPDLLPEMYETVTGSEGYDCVATRRYTRLGEPIIRSFFARTFYRLINRISQTEIIDGARDFRFMSRQMVDAIVSLREYNRFLKGIYGWVGFKTKWIEYENVERVAGETKWSFWKLFLYALEGIVAFSTAPLAFVTVIGIFLCIMAFIALLILIIRALFYGHPMAGWPSLISIIIFWGGIQLFCMGIIGLYLSKTYLETKKRPVYILKRKDNMDYYDNRRKN